MFDIEGLGEKSIVEFFVFGWLESFVDVFCLCCCCVELVGCEGWKDKFVDNLLVVIEVKCWFDVVWLLFGFGICYVGVVIVCDFMKCFVMLLVLCVVVEWVYVEEVDV